MSVGHFLRSCVAGLVAVFFASRSRHTRLVSDWSADVCSFVFKQKTAYEIGQGLEFRRVLFRSQAEDGIRDWSVTGVQTCALPIYTSELQSLTNLVCRLLLEIGQ